MTITEQDQTYLMDLAAVLKALREAREEAAQVVQQLRAQQQACRDLDARATTALTQAVQRATAALQHAQAQTIEQSGAEMRRQHTRLVQHWEAVVAQAARVQRWLPWKVALLLLGATLLVNAGVTTWWGQQQAAERQALRGYQRLALELDRHLLDTLYPQLTKAQQRALDTVYTATHFTPLGTRREEGSVRK